MIIKKKVKVEQEFIQCDWCDKSTDNPVYELDFAREPKYNLDSYIIECPGCGLHVCPDHREVAADTAAVIPHVVLCENCMMIWKVVSLHNATMEKIKKEGK